MTHPADRSPTSGASPAAAAPAAEPLPDRVEVAVVGGGPVGLLLGCRLCQMGIGCVVLERALQVSRHSRAIGIHPPSLEKLDELGLVDAFLARGVRVPGGVAVAGTRRLGELTFETCPGPYTFALSLPQDRTEALLEAHLLALDPQALQRGAEAERLEVKEDEVHLHGSDRTGRPFTLACRMLAGCDGTDSLVRQQAGIPFAGSPYPDSFVMGDFGDNTSFGATAYLFLSPGGLVESFPLPGARRRWVVRTGHYVKEPRREAFCAEVLQRTGHDISDQPQFLLGPFGIQRYMARRFALGRIALCGDAAHVMSPIGGQGMNTGWMDAWDLAEAARSALREGEPLPQALEAYDRRSRPRAARVIRRAAFNTRMGRPGIFDPLRNLIVRGALRVPPLRRRMARIFTMRNL